MSERMAEARVEAERRWPVANGDDPIDLEAHFAQAVFAQGVEWADDNPKPHTITHDDMGAAYAAFMDAEGHPVRRFIVALKAIGIGVEDNDE